MMTDADLKLCRAIAERDGWTDVCKRDEYVVSNRIS